MFASVEDEYRKNPDLKPEDVKVLIKWCQHEHCFPKITEFQAIQFLQSCYFDQKAAKSAIAQYCKIRKSLPEIFGERNLDILKATLDVLLLAALPKRTKEDYFVMVSRLIDPTPSNYNFKACVTLFDMVCNLAIAQYGTASGHLLVIDATGTSFGHLIRMNISIARTFITYLQEAFPVRLKGVHVINSMPILQRALNLVKPFIKSELIELIQFHPNMESFHKVVPAEILPKEFGGCEETIEELKEKIKSNLFKYEEFFKEEKRQMDDDSPIVLEQQNEREMYVDQIVNTDRSLERIDKD